MRGAARSARRRRTSNPSGKACWPILTVLFHTSIKVFVELDHTLVRTVYLGCWAAPAPIPRLWPSVLACYCCIAVLTTVAVILCPQASPGLIYLRKSQGLRPIRRSASKVWRSRSAPKQHGASVNSGLMPRTLRSAFVVRALFT